MYINTEVDILLSLINSLYNVYIYFNNQRYKIFNTICIGTSIVHCVASDGN